MWSKMLGKVTADIDGVHMVKLLTPIQSFQNIL